MNLYDIRGKSEEDCKKYPHFKRAEAEAKNLDDVLLAKGL